MTPTTKTTNKKKKMNLKFHISHEIYEIEKISYPNESTNNNIRVTFE
jgi:hypothetical protein